MKQTTNSNKIEIVKLQGEIKLIKQSIETIKTNHLVHLDQKVNQIYKILWLLVTIGLTQIFNLIRQLLVN
tara:strand:- start:11 stop:220 length:210 start_codon:yes stop_codon:yes gene_type:complete